MLDPRRISTNRERDSIVAMHASNGITLALLFLAGYHGGRPTNVPPWKSGLAMISLGLLLVAITIPLGG